MSTAADKAGGGFHRWLWGGTLVANLLVVGIVSLVALQSRQQATDQARFLTENYSRILEEGLVGFIQKIDLTLLTVIDEV
ncbi:MAG: hypothetical protein JNM82_13800, partial [Rhodocyclaceae bacterium]|nr:hypothetical protein [Rhodocyclaceae bacterium]